MRPPGVNKIIPGYTRIDLRLGWQVEKNLSVDILASNLQDEVHPEARESLKLNTGIERGLYVKADYRF